MDAVAYTDDAVISFITENVIPLRILADHPVLGPQFRIKWTPSLHVLDFEGSEHYRGLGFYPPDDLIPFILLGMGKAYFNRASRRAASDCFGRLLSKYPKNSQAPEAVYMDGVAKFIEGHDVSHLIALYDRLAAEYPESPWFTKADPYKFLKK